MKYIHNEVLFKSHAEALRNYYFLKENSIVLYTCAKCGIHFGSDDPYTSDHGIICRVCMKTMNLMEVDNYRPEIDYFENGEGE